MTEPRSLQEELAPENRCFGCGPANDKGLKIRSFADGGEVVCTWQAETHHEAWDGTLSGGVLGTLFDCHMNWTAAVHLMRRNDIAELPATVTAEFAVQMKAPTSSRVPVELRARVVESSARKAVVEATCTSEGRVTATGRGVFVAVEPGHPAYHRW